MLFLNTNDKILDEVSLIQISNLIQQLNVIILSQYCKLTDYFYKFTFFMNVTTQKNSFQFLFSNIYVCVDVQFLILLQFIKIKIAIQTTNSPFFLLIFFGSIVIFLILNPFFSNQALFAFIFVQNAHIIVNIYELMRNVYNILIKDPMGNKCSSKSAPVLKNPNQSQWALGPEANQLQFKNFSNGKNYQNQGLYAQAIDCYSLATKINPNSSMSFSGLGNCYLKTTDFGRSIDNYKKALAIDPQNKFACNGLGSAYACAMNKERAIQHFNKALQIDPNFAYPYNGLGGLAYTQKNFEQALNNYQKALTLDPDNPVILANIACSHASLGRTNEAAKYFTQAEKAAYNNPYMTKTNEDYLQIKLQQYQSLNKGTLIKA